MSTANREAYLIQAVDVLRALYPIPEIRVSVGLPFARNQRETRVQYWGPEASADKIAQVFISPLVADSAEALKLLHGALCSGSDRPLTPEIINQVIEVLGPYPTAALTLPECKPPRTPLLKVWCAQCKYTMRITKKWLDRAIPTCPVCIRSNDLKMSVEVKG